MSDSPLWLPVAVLFGLLLLAYLGMWRGWRRRGRKHHLPPLAEVPAEPAAGGLRADAVCFGTTVSGDWLDRVVARGPGARRSCRLVLSAGGLDVLRPRRPFRIPADALRGARHDQGIAGKVVPPHGVLVVSWQHGAYRLDTGFRLFRAELSQAPPAGAADPSVQDWHDAWVLAISGMSQHIESVEGESP
jgi:hypothetical protein